METFPGYKKLTMGLLCAVAADSYAVAVPILDRQERLMLACDLLQDFSG